jgi:hypothetical protein
MSVWHWTLYDKDGTEITTGRDMVALAAAQDLADV